MATRNNLRTQYYTENDGAGGVADASLALPDNWSTYSPQAKINWFNANGVTPDQLLQAGVSQGDINWMSQNGYGAGNVNALAAGGSTGALAAGGTPSNLPAGAEPIYELVGQTEQDIGTPQLVGYRVSTPTSGGQFVNQIYDVNGNFQRTTTSSGKEDYGVPDLLKLAATAAGANLVGAGLGQPSAFGPGTAAATGSGASTATLSSADKAALFGDVGYGAGMSGAQTAAYDAVIANGGTAADALAAADAAAKAAADKAAADAAAKAAADKAAADAAAKAAADKAAADAAAKTATTAADTAATKTATDAATKVATTAATAATDPYAYLLPAIGSLISGYTQGQSAKEAAEATAAASTRAAELQRDAQREALALQARMYDEAVARQQPYYQAGTNALAQMQGRTNAMPEAFQYGGEIPQFSYSGQQPAAFQYTGQQPTFEYGGQQPEAFKFTAENFQADPGYAFRLSEGLKALERSAAARGGLLSGGTGKALTRFGQEMGSQEFQNAYGRAFNEYGAARQREQEQYGRALTGFDIARQREAQEYGRGLTGYDINRQREQEQYGRALTGYNALRSRESDMYGRALTGYNALRQREADQYNRLAGLAGIGGTTAQQLTAAGQNYGSQAGNLMANTATNLSNLAMQQGNTAGNALLAQGAAYGRAFGDLGYLGGQYLGYPRP